jgi:hypothetical protein
VYGTAGVFLHESICIRQHTLFKILSLFPIVGFFSVFLFHFIRESFGKRSKDTGKGKVAFVMDNLIESVHSAAGILGESDDPSTPKLPPQTSEKSAANSRTEIQMVTGTTPVTHNPIPNTPLEQSPARSDISLDSTHLDTSKATSLPETQELKPKVAVEVKPTKPEKDESGADYFDYTLALGGFTVLGFYLTAAELQLKWNNLDGINSVSTTGQIIPLGIGSLSLLRTLYLLRTANWSRLTKDPDEVEKPVEQTFGYRAGHAVGAWIRRMTVKNPKRAVTEV